VSSQITVLSICSNCENKSARRCLCPHNRLAVQKKKSLVRTQTTAGKPQLILFEYLIAFKFNQKNINIFLISQKNIKTCYAHKCAAGVEKLAE
jgi:hypothetical protein